MQANILKKKKKVSKSFFCLVGVQIECFKQNRGRHNLVTLSLSGTEIAPPWYFNKILVMKRVLLLEMSKEVYLTQIVNFDVTYRRVIPNIVRSSSNSPIHK